MLRGRQAFSLRPQGENQFLFILSKTAQKVKQLIHLTVKFYSTSPPKPQRYQVIGCLQMETFWIRLMCYVGPLDEMEWKGDDDEDGKKKKKKKKKACTEQKDDIVEEMAAEKVSDKEHAAENEAACRKRATSSEGTGMEIMTDVKTSQKKADKKRRRSHSSELSGGEGHVEKPAKMRKVDEESEVKGTKGLSLLLSAFGLYQGESQSANAEYSNQSLDCLFLVATLTRTEPVA